MPEATSWETQLNSARRSDVGSWPWLPRVYLPRQRLCQELDAATQNSVTVLVAPAGAGKTLGVSGWLRVAAAAESRTPAWLEGDDPHTPQRLERMLAESRVPADHHVGRSYTSRPASSQAGAPVGSSASSLAACEVTITVPGDGPLDESRGGSHHASTTRLIVVDDAHLLPPQTVRLLDERLNRAPETMRVLLLTRWDLPLTRLVPEMLGDLTTLRGDLLRLSEAECAQLIRAHARTEDPEIIGLVTQRTLGWCGAVVLAARTVGRALDPLVEARRLADGEAQMADLVISEVFSTLTSRQRHLLLCITHERSVSVATAARLTGDSGAGTVLGELEATGFLVTRMHEQARTCADDHGPETGVAHDTAPAAALVELADPDPQPMADPVADWAADPVGDFVADVPGDTVAETVLGEPAGEEVCYRIHPLLAEVVRRRLVAGGVDVEQARGTVTRAVRLDVELGDLRNALERLVGVGAHEEAADLLSEEGVRIVLGRLTRVGVTAFAHAHPQLVDARPGTWFPLALEYWLENDVDSARHWCERLLTYVGETGGAEDAAHWSDRIQFACVHLWRSLLGLESIPRAIARAENLVATQAQWAATPEFPRSRDAAMPVLLTALGMAHNWMGDCARAEANLTLAVLQSRSSGYREFAVDGLTHLALTQYMAGREHACLQLAQEALAASAAENAGGFRFAPARAALALMLGQLSDVSVADMSMLTMAGVSAEAPPVHSADLCAQFWIRMCRARLALLAGSSADAEQLLVTPSEYAELAEVNLPKHLRAVVLVERALLAALSSDRHELRELAARLESLDAHGEVALARGLSADLAGDLGAAVAAFANAAETAVYAQPPTRAIALTCQAQLLDAVGDTEQALRCLRIAATETQVRRNAVPFLGWTRQGTPSGTLLAKLCQDEGSSLPVWVEELRRRQHRGHDVTSMARSRAADPRERASVAALALLPVLSPRERAVLNELARGATYGDAAAALHVSENTIKTHVTNVYAKLGVHRRSEALAAARVMGLL